MDLLAARHYPPHGAALLLSYTTLPEGETENSPLPVPQEGELNTLMVCMKMLPLYMQKTTNLLSCFRKGGSG